MSLLNDLTTYLNNADSTLQSLADSIIARQSQTILLSDPCSANPPSVTASGVWTLSQDTADGNGIYAGVYQFALDTACSYLTIQSVTGHTTPANTSYPPARYTDCNDVVHDLTSVNDLSDKQVKHFEILSDTAFTITLTVIQTYCVELDMENLPGTIDVLCGTPNDREIVGINSVCNGAYFASLIFNFPTATVTRVEATYT